jgi:Transglycosylase-like domain
MAARSRHAKPKSRASKAGSLVAAAAALGGVAAAFVLLQGGGQANAGLSRPASASGAASSGSTLADNLVATAIHRASAATQARAAALRAKAAARRRHAAASAARQRQTAPTQASSPPPTGDAAHSALGICIRNAEEGGSYAWGPGNGGGAYQFLLSTWERYGGAASEYGVAGPAYQDRIFDNAIAAGGASNWTAYDGC